MLLTLTLQGPSRLMGAARSRTLSAGSLLIGRSPVCDWVLPDPERVVSGRHCRIDAEPNRFVLTDLSTNGVFLGEAGEPLGPGGVAELRDGQVLRLGDARILVALSGEAGETPGSQADRLIADDWFAPTAAVEAPMPMPIPLPAATAPVIPDFDDLLVEELTAPPMPASALPAMPAVPFEPVASEPATPFRPDAPSGAEVMAALDEALVFWEPETAARLRADLARALARRGLSGPALGPGEIGPGEIGHA
ncbi:type VI secretion system-associated FHA domain protein [Aureimonas ureilytica]|uniref:type VI secretion system-associated FHA domain protein n=1 Tax=Aureimonas ureilytica TaxID=401562 RepID=UPI003CE82EA6